MNKYIELIAEIEVKSILGENKKEKLDFTFNANDPDKSDRETAKLICYFDETTYIHADGIRLYFINDGLLYYEDDLLKYVMSVLNYNIQKGHSEEVEVLSYYLLSLLYSYKKGAKYLANDKNSVYLNRFGSFFNTQRFYNNGDILINALVFAQEVVEFATLSKENALNLSDLLIDCCRICYTNNVREIQGSLKVLVNYGTYHNKEFIGFDLNIASNFKAYFDYELTMMKNGHMNELTVIRQLYKESLIDKEREKEIAQVFELRLVDVSGEKDGTRLLFSLGKLESDVKLIRNISYTSKQHKVSLRAILHKIQKVKRDAVKSFDDSKMSTYEFSTEIPNEYIENSFKSYEEDILKGIYRQCMINFEYLFEGSLKRRLEFVFSSLASAISINNKNEGLFRVEENEDVNTGFSKYYNKKIEEYFNENKDNYPNKHLFEKDGAYDQLLHYAKETYQIHIGIPKSLLVEKFGEDVAGIVFKKISGSNHSYKNDYQIMILSMILQTELAITELFNHFEKEKRDGFEEAFLGKVFEHIVEYDEKLANGFMYINFVLYDKNGLRIRDSLAHGNFECGFKDLTVFLMVVVSLMHASVVHNALLRKGCKC